MNKKNKYKLEPLLKKNKWELLEGTRDIKASQDEILRIKKNSDSLIDEIKNTEDMLRDSMSENRPLSTDMYAYLSAYINDQYKNLEEHSLILKEKENKHEKLSEEIKKLNKFDKGLNKHKEKTQSEHLLKLQEYEINQNDEIFNTRVRDRG